MEQPNLITGDLEVSYHKHCFVSDKQLKNGENNIAGDSDVELHWTSAMSQPPYSEYHRRSPRPSTSSISSSENSMPAQTHSTPPSPVAQSHNERLISVG